MFQEAKPTLRPLPAYSELYPFSEDVMANMAYHFEARDTRSLLYFEPVSKVVMSWRKAWSVRPCSLTWESVGDAVVIRDRRPGFTRRNFRLTGDAVAVFHALDRPRKLDAVAQELAPRQKLQLTVIQPEAIQHEGSGSGSDPRTAYPRRGVRSLKNRIADRLVREESVSFTREDFARQPDACVKALVDAGVIYVDDGLYLTLPVSEYRRPQQADWITFTIPRAGDGLRRFARTVRTSLIDWRQIALDRLVKQN
jgi:hypothetical protein